MITEAADRWRLQMVRGLGAGAGGRGQWTVEMKPPKYRQDPTSSLKVDGQVERRWMSDVGGGAR